MPSDASVREFIHSDPDFSAHEFLELCENVMRNSGITGERDKIAFVRARVKQGSEASKSMQVSALVRPTRQGDYTAFRQRFLKVFGENQRHSLVKGVYIAAERLLAEVNSQSFDRAQRGAHKLSDDLTRYLKDNGWGTADSMPWENITQFLEFLMYMLLLNSKARSGTQELKYSPGDELLEFTIDLHGKRDATQGEAALISPVVEASNVTSGVAALQLNTTAHAGSNTPKQVVVCSYCRKTGHTENKCFALKREKKKNMTSGGAHVSNTPAPTQSSKDKRQPQAGTTKRSFQRGNANTPQPNSPRSQGAQGGGSYCHFHESTSHSTDDCFTLAKIKRDMRSQGSSRVGGTSSGEAMRPRQHDPT